MKKINHALLAVVAVIVVAGCMGKQATVVDNSPKNPTAVMKAEGAINGFVLPDMSFKSVTYTRKDRRATKNNIKYDSWVSRQLLGNSKETTIVRLDKNVLWTLFKDGDKKKYLECPLGGCELASLRQFDDKQSQGDEAQFDYDPNDEAASACKTRQTKNSFKVVETGKKRTISGQETREYQAKWVTEYTDAEGRKDSNRMNIVFWNTQPDAGMKKVNALNAEMEKALLRKVAAKNNALAKVIPDNVFAALSAFTGADKKSRNVMAREFKKVKGQPMSVKLEWYLDRKACVEVPVAKKKEKRDWSNPLAAMKDAASDMVGKQTEKMFMPNPKEPVFRYVYQVTEARLKPVHDSVFEIPKGYTIATRE